MKETKYIKGKNLPLAKGGKVILENNPIPMATKKELFEFVESLNNRGLLSIPIESFDYEWVIWDYLKTKELIIKYHAPTKAQQ